MQQEIFLVEELETIFTYEVVIYDKKCDHDWETTLFDPFYYDNLLSGKVFWAFIQLIHDRIKLMEPKEAVRYLSLSIAQFQSHAPANRWEEFLHKYHSAFFAPEIVEYKVNKNRVRLLSYVWDSYKNHFSFFKEETEKVLDELKASAFGIQPPIRNNSIKISSENFDKLIITLMSHMKLSTPPLVYMSDLMKCYFAANNEILDNLIILNKDDRLSYIKKLIYQVNELGSFKHIKKGKVDFWLEKYSFKSAYHIFASESELQIILSSYPMQVNDKYTADFDKEHFEIQTDFLAYYAKDHKDQLSEFLNEQTKFHSPTPTNPTDGKQITPQSLPPKLKTNLTVPQLAYLFKMLMDIKPSIFDIKSNKELYQFIEANFTTKGKVDAGPTIAKLNNLYSDVDKSTGNFWAEKLAKMLQDARKI